MKESMDFWKVFTQTGRVEDYLAYRGQARAAGHRKGEAYAPHDRRADHPGAGDRGT